MKLHQFDLDLLLALDELIKERSVTRAGANLGLSQPAMSGALARLRSLLDDPLLERVGRESRLTPFAAQLAGPLQSILSDVTETLDRESSFDAATSKRVFRLAGSDYATIVAFKPLLAYMSNVAPGVQLRFQRVGDDTASKLAACDIDISVQPEPAHMELASQHLFSDRIVCAIAAGNTEVQDALTEAQFHRLCRVAYSYPTYGLNLLDRMQPPSRVSCGSRP